ncbi:MAG TPA: O-antigen ligase family protein [Gaiellaceae bacterium]|jgi:O-antigen ligase
MYIPGTLAVSTLVGIMLGTGNGKAALTLCAVPILTFLYNCRFWVVLVMVALTIAFGRNFTYLHFGPVYVLDAVLLFILVAALPEILEDLARLGTGSLLMLSILILTAASVFESGLTVEVLRNAVLGFYVVWAAVGVMLAFRGKAAEFAGVSYMGSIAATVVFVLWFPGHSLLGSQLELVGVASSAYMAMGVLLVLFAPSLAPRGWLPAAVCLMQLALIAAGQFRSVWVGLALAIVVTLLISGGSRAVWQRIRWYLLIGGMTLLASAVLVAPTAVQNLKAEGRSIYSYGGRSTSDLNARWRIGKWKYAKATILSHPWRGIGFRGQEVPVQVCSPSCDRPTSPKPRPGAALHNSILAFGLRLGFPGLVAFALFVVAVLRATRRAARTAQADLARWLCAVNLLFLFTAAFAVVLEGPYMGVIFWITGGMVLAMPLVDRTPKRSELVGATPVYRPAVVRAR